MRNNLLVAAMLLFLLSVSACGNSGSSDGAIKVDTVINPADNTNAKQSDSTLPRGAVGMDTAVNGQSNSSGLKDTSKHR